MTLGNIASLALGHGAAQQSGAPCSTHAAQTSTRASEGLRRGRVWACVLTRCALETLSPPGLHSRRVIQLVRRVIVPAPAVRDMIDLLGALDKPPPVISLDAVAL